MCVVIVKTAEQKKPSKEFLKKAWDKNSDGAGIMYNKDNKVYIEKGFMTFDKFWKRASKLEDNMSIVYHFRIATHGARDKKGTHPFPITKNDTFLQQQFVKTNVGVAHNGIISLTSNYPKEKNKYNLSDTQLFIRDYLTTLTQLPNWYNSEIVDNIIASLIGNSNKIAMLYKNGAIKLYGNFVDVQGYKCSNNYFSYTPVTNYGFNYSSIYDSYDRYDYTDLKFPILIDKKKYKDTVFIEDKEKEVWYDIDQFDSVKITAYNTVMINNNYSRSVNLVDYTGNKLYYTDFDNGLVTTNEELLKEIEEEEKL